MAQIKTEIRETNLNGAALNALLKEDNHLEARMDAFLKTFAFIEFRPDGTILDANPIFLQALGYQLSEIKGQHHRMFCETNYAKSTAYKKFWENLAAGKSFTDELDRKRKDGSTIWIKASYIPVFDSMGRVTSVVKLAQDITAQKLQNADYQGQLAAISKSQAVIEFELDGTILNANSNFLNATGYSLEEVRGKHHRMFCDPTYAKSDEYQNFWRKLARGEFDSGEYKRFGKGGREIWIQASYNPILDFNGQPFKVVKYATDITAQKLQNAYFNGQIEAISKSQAVIEFELDGSIVHANDNFLAATGYSLEEIRGKHHRMFCESSYVNSPEYKKFWEKLGRGEYDSGEYKRVGKGGKEVWIHASYNPILDLNGKPFKVVKFAADITAEKTQRMKLVAQLTDTATHLSSSATELGSVSEVMVANSNETMSQTENAAALTTQVSANVETTATAAEEMESSVREISRSASEAATVASQAVQVTAKTKTTVESLGVSSRQIGEVIKVITSIAGQTNLLALNATIEAARAGEAGKGFAVVANEVKELAKETALATEDITKKIAAIQKDTAEMVDAIDQIGTVIDRVNDISNSIASSVEEQSATTSEIARSMGEASTGSVEISNMIKWVLDAARGTSQGACDTSKAATELSKYAESLNALVHELKG